MICKYSLFPIDHPHNHFAGLFSVCRKHHSGCLQRIIYRNVEMTDCVYFSLTRPTSQKSPQNIGFDNQEPWICLHIWTSSELCAELSEMLYSTSTVADTIGGGAGGVAFKKYDRVLWRVDRTLWNEFSVKLINRITNEWMNRCTVACRMDICGLACFVLSISPKDAFPAVNDLYI